MVRDTGIPISTYQRIEAGTYDKPPYQQLYNSAVVLEVDVTELIEEKSKTWTVFHISAPSPPRCRAGGRKLMDQSPARPTSSDKLACIECGCGSAPSAHGWRGYIVDLRR